MNDVFKIAIGFIVFTWIIFLGDLGIKAVKKYKEVRDHRQAYQRQLFFKWQLERRLYKYLQQPPKQYEIHPYNRDWWDDLA
jgi:hypothetical protein